MRKNRVSILIPAYNCEKTIAEALNSCVSQIYSDLEIIVCDNASTDITTKIVKQYPQVRLEVNPGNIGFTANMEKLIKLATGKFIVFLCADDYFTDEFVIAYTSLHFRRDSSIGYIGRYYYQFLDGDPKPVRVMRTLNPYLSADNPSGLAFRKEALSGKVGDKPFLEAAVMVKEVLKKWKYAILPYDVVAVRIKSGDNGSQQSHIYRESPLLNWVKLAGKERTLLTSFVSLVQIRNWSKYRYLLREIWYFIILRPVNLFRTDFWFFVLLTALLPKTILRKLAYWYKKNIGSWTARRIER
jgi:glycosyltransferase involved in cell wall biosynthesis